MTNAMLVIPDFTMHYLSAQLDPFVVVTNVSASPVALDLFDIVVSYLEHCDYVLISCDHAGLGKYSKYMLEFLPLGFSFMSIDHSKCF